MADGADSGRLFAGEGEMAARMRAFDWERHELGPVAAWPNSLRTLVSVVLASRFPMLLWWGPRLFQLYNDGYRPILGDKHPASLAAQGALVWAEIWHVIGPMAEAVLAGGPATWSENLLLMMQRKGFLEEAYFSFSYSGVPDDEGGRGGVLVTVQETTVQVQDERQLRILRDLAARAVGAKSLDAALRGAAEALEPYAADVPFALLYRLDDEGTGAVLVATAGLDGAGPQGPAPRVQLAGTAASHGAGPQSPFDLAAESGQPVLVESLAEVLGTAATPLRPRVPANGWAPPVAAIVQPIAGAGTGLPYGFLVAGVSPHRELDERYRGLFTLAADQVSRAMVNVRAYEEERRRAEALAEIDRAKTAFFSNVSHEFRTPLTLMLGPLADLLARPEGELEPVQLELLQTVQRSALRMLRLVNTLLDFSRLEAGRVRASYEPVDLASLTAELASMFRSAVERAGLRLIVDCPPLPEPVWVDREMWEKVVSNLLSNAFKFTLEGEIAVSMRAESGAAVLGVRDTGEGIPERELPLLFQRFHRVEGARGRTHEGTGIGLALVQDLVRLHGGEVRVESAPGEGSTFTVTVPLGSAHLPAGRLERAAERAPTHGGAEAFVVEALRWLPDGMRAERGVEDVLAAPIPAGRDRAAGATVLLADDNADMRHYLERLLAPRYHVLAAADGEEALRLAEERELDLVLSDVMMPRLDGFGLIAALRAEPRTAALPVILLSARAGEEAVAEGMAAGADDYLVKPFSARELLARVEGTLALASSRREAAAALRESEERFRLMADDSPVMVWVTEGDGSCSFLSRSWYELTGQTPEEALGFGWLEAVHPDDRARTRAEWAVALDRGEPIRVEYRLRRGDGEYRWVIEAARPRTGRVGEPSGFIGSVIDITERKAAEEALEEADRRKDEFLSVLAHELRNPLAPIRSGVELLRIAGEEAPTRERALDAMARQVAHLVRLVDDLMEVSRIRLGKLVLRREPTDLAAAAATALETHQGAIAAGGLRVEQDLEPGTVVDGDPVRLTQVISNLVHNAVKFTPPGGQVAVRARLDGGHAELTVTDTGKGMSAAELGRAFELFAQASSPGGDAAGLGIGLTLARRIAELHGGTLEAESGGRGAGTRLILRLPLALVAATGPKEVGERAPRPAPTRAGTRVLVVDDNEDAADSLAELLRVLGAQAHAVYDGESALRAAARERLDVIFLDLSMPGRDGFAVARGLRERGETAWLVALTGHGHEEDRRRTAQAGFDDHLVKPVDAASVLRALERAAAGTRRAPEGDLLQEGS